MRAERGFTLIESVMVIAIAGIVIAIVAIFIVPATTAYFASSDRAQLGDQADTALRRLARDLSQALPNSARVSASGMSVELIPVSGAARYAVESGDTLRFGVVDGSFAIVGPALNLSHAAQQLAWYNLGAGIPDADAYTLNNVRTSSSGAGNAASVDIIGAALPTSLLAPPYRVYAIEPPVSYRCDLTAKTLTRYTGYGFKAVQPDPPVGGSSAVLAKDVSACSFSFNAGAVAARYGLVTLQISLSRNNETVTLYHAVHVDNMP
ncbi:MSHA biogenesis protein MshO [Pelomonas saccharophila]|uniref:MSHA biogenesis protein MshO n=1 Tax=Roseateles saccharophilus TaxID=304 RepID=A0ABU1YGY1_ROSSA|nr:prepilin-type N-terminal cleavage/methylation domain-containing protein [Roseateles saccharophilus]MDR7267500.1 MSHA biogenesis protein MshO [Roseateles saccharophilus]